MLRTIVILIGALASVALPASAQSPNNASIVVLVTDQSGAVVRDAKVSVTNRQTGATREAASGADGSASFPALPLTGAYSVVVSKAGFGDESRNDITLRSSETATLKVKLLVGSEKTDVTVYGTDKGVRADAQIGVRLDSQTIDETPILGRKVTTLPLFNSAFRQGKGTGDLFVNATYFITGSGSRRTTTYMDAIEELEGVPSKVKPDEIKLAKQVIGNFEGQLDLTEYKDAYQEELQRIIDAKIAGEEVVAAEEETPPKVVNLMDALRQSLDRVSTQKKKSAKADIEAPVKAEAPKAREKKRARG